MKRVLTITLTLVVLLLAGFFIIRSVRASGSKDENQYRIATVKRDLVKKTVTATGTLTPWTTVDIKSRAGGRLISLPVDAGSIVKKGQTIAEIDPSDTLLTVNQAKADIENNHARIEETSKTLALQQAQTEVTMDTALANLASARASASAAKARYESAKSQADAQKGLTEADVASAEATLASEKAKLTQMTSATQRQQVASALAAYRQAEANLVNAEATLRRNKALLEKGFVSQSQVDQAQASYDVARATVSSAKEVSGTILPQMDADLKAEQARVRQTEALLNSAKANQVNIELKKQAAEAAYADYQQALAQVKQAEANVRSAQASRINNQIRQTQIVQAQAQAERSKATLVNANIQLHDTHVTAPSDGIVLKKYVEQGTLITSGISFNSTGTSIVQMGDISRMYVDVQVDETDVASVDVDQKVDITFDAYSTTAFEGKVIKVDPQAVIDSNVTTVHVRVEVDNTAPSYRLLKPGMNASCEFIVDRKDDVVSVPNEALHSDTNGNRYVEIANGGKVAPTDKGSEPDPNLFVGVKPEKRKVEVGLEGNDSTEITNGLKEGEKIVTQTIEPSPPTAGGNPFGGSRGPGRR